MFRKMQTTYFRKFQWVLVTKYCLADIVRYLEEPLGDFNAENLEIYRSFIWLASCYLPYLPRLRASERAFSLGNN